MPYPIKGAAGTGAIASYQLGPGEEWTLHTASFSLVPFGSAGGDDFAYFDMRDPAGGIILLQPLSPSDGANMFYSLAAGVEPFVTAEVNPPYYPQDAGFYGYSYVTQRIPFITLYSGCTVNAYKPTGAITPPTDPITQLSPWYSIPDLHLWVENTLASQVAASGQDSAASSIVGPYMLVPGPGA